MNFNQARFLTSAAAMRGLPPDQGSEVAFVGRSNAGKSSAINRLCARRNLARTSSTPGRTRLLNFFALDEDAFIRLVDLPGYGYAKAPKTEQAKWAKLIEAYLAERRSLTGLVLLADSRLPLKPTDEQLLDWSRASELPTLVLLTKADKLSRNEQSRAVANARSRLPTNAEPLAFSAVSGLGLDTAQAWIASHLD
ncbi:MAG TPA: ribosome biogenesis GTP-binding protein YihA/YsxC [Gammaproteobacteria bacterium]|nr:ribosome biogenesis GTP-binding protein YihA/YsxC [Gammaproteobacteria bacterium]